jgi:ribosomal protein L37AE/L43A
MSSPTTSSSDTAGHSGTGERAVPYCCPFCTEEDLRPLESGAVEGLTRGGWHCRSCLRVFSLTFHGVHQPVFASPQSLSTNDRPPLESDRS